MASDILPEEFKLSEAFFEIPYSLMKSLDREAVELEESLEYCDEGIVLGRAVELERDFTLKESLLEHNFGVFGIPVERRRTNLKLIEEAREAGFSYLVMDYMGRYARIINSIRSAKVFRMGVNFGIKLLDPLDLDVEYYDNMLLEVMSLTLGLGRTEARLLGEALREVRRRGPDTPSIKELLLTLEEMENKPTLTTYEYARIDSLCRALAPLLKGRTAAAFDTDVNVEHEDLVCGVTVVDLSHLSPPRARALAQAAFLLRLLSIKPKKLIVLVDEAHHVLSSRAEIEGLEALLCIIEELNRAGTSLHLSSTTLSSLSYEALGMLNLVIVHRLVSDRDLRALHVLLSLDAKKIRRITKLKPGEALVDIMYKGKPIIVYIGEPLSLMYPEPSEEEIDQHMKKLGFELKPLQTMEAMKPTLIERDFESFAEHIFELLKAMGEQIVTRGEAIRFLEDKGIPADHAAKLIDALQMYGYVREDYLGGRRCLVITRKGIIALDEHERMKRTREARSIIRRLEGDNHVRRS